MDAGSTDALGLGQEQHWKDEGFRNAWLTTVERGWAVGNMGGTVTQEKTGAGNRNPGSWGCAWETKARVDIKYYPGESAGREQRWGGKASEGDSDVGTVWGGNKTAREEG